MWPSLLSLRRQSTPVSQQDEILPGLYCPSPFLLSREKKSNFSLALNEWKMTLHLLGKASKENRAVGMQQQV